ncbi:hypothetical protein GA0070606_0339 [Micromonospora citrea]|uniref:Uncharacterized protein n=1 Tax=Micromonospora citrea TaxID=47855 RepID=A0A1C6TSC6_9ACTN|nr:hypothetical protein [Micromonospora citrea]SCL44543.1 hypothetical protein GA0070606_0339 [Micromonospora citrea]
MDLVKRLPARVTGVRVGRSRRGQAAALALVATAVAVFVAPKPSMAGGDPYFVGCESSSASCQTGVKVAGPVGVCMTESATYASTSVCLDYNGDHVYVRDGSADGRSAMARIDSERGLAYRYCRNTHGHGSWARCNFDWSEAGRKTVNAGYRQNYATMPLSYLWSFSNN